jgi:hypothetical protein
VENMAHSAYCRVIVDELPSLWRHINTAAMRVPNS